MSLETLERPKAKKLVINPKLTRRVKFVDKAADIVIKFFGILVILVVALIFIFIGKECLPLFLPAGSSVKTGRDLPALVADGVPLVAGMDEYELHAYFIHKGDGKALMYSLPGLEPQGELAFAGLQGRRLTAAYRTPARDYLFLGTADGRVLMAKMEFAVSFEGSQRIITPQLKEYALLELPAPAEPVELVYGTVSSAGDMIFAAVTQSGRVFTGKTALDEEALLEKNQGLVEGAAAAEDREAGAESPVHPVEAAFDGKITRILVDRDEARLFALTDTGRLYHFYLESSRTEPFAVYSGPDFNRPDTGKGRRPTAMDFVIGENALLLGFDDGSLEQWFGVRAGEDDTQQRLRAIRTFDPLPSAVTLLQPSARDKSFIAGSSDGTLHLGFTTSARTLLSWSLPAPVATLAYAPKLDGVLALDAKGGAQFRIIRNPHPEISFGTLFGKVWYEGYPEPDHVWQSSSGSDDFEAKYSLTPLLWGTVKAAFYGLLFAIPVAIMAALYVSQFMPYEIRSVVKPTVEIMAALPSVVIGFLAGLWLAPLLEDKLVMLAVFAVFVPVATILGAMAWHKAPRRWRDRVPPGRELLILIPLVLAVFFLSLPVGSWIDLHVFGGDIRQWIFSAFGTKVEQRNSIVIGFAMGFAVIPIIFTISEDAFSNVPKSFSSASYALGASKWQTAWRVVLPTASPGVFSAVMIGFGRAVGETMIVLMATGNTPIMSVSPFNGMRTLSANIAVEIPEAALGTTHYRVLFLAAMLLFVLTFSVNTVAEVVRQRLRQKYQAV